MVVQNKIWRKLIKNRGTHTPGNLKGGKKVETIEKIIGGNFSDCNGDDDPGNDSGQCGKHIYRCERPLGAGIHPEMEQ